MARAFEEDFDRLVAGKVEPDRAGLVALDEVVIPVVVVAGGQPMFGVDAVTWLGDEVERRGLIPPG